MTKPKRLVPGDDAPNGICLGVDEQDISLVDLWAKGPTFLTFLRHFG
jgi:hypothetical protein